MFLDFYQMREQPFGVTPDPRFLYLGQSHREALASLFYGIQADRGFVALIAQPGLGKTTLTFQLLEKLQQAARTVFLFHTQCDSNELFHYLLNALGVDATGMDIVSMHNKINEILSREMLAGRRFVLAIDEAQNLDPEVLETIRLLSNFETSQSKLLQILLIGQPQLARKLASPSLEQLQQRISVFARLEPFGSEDTARYIAHRLQVAGYGGGPLFTPGALRLIADESQGIPRKINRLCFGALSLGCAMKRKQVDAVMVGEVIADLDVESIHRPRVAPRVMPLPVTTSPVLSSYSAKPKQRSGRWALGATAVAASIAIGFAVLSYSPARIGRFLEASTDAWASIRDAAASIGISTKVNSPIPSALDVQAAELPNAGPGQSPPLSTDNETSAVIVQPGETLRHIVLRNMGTYDGDTINLIRKLNPAIADLDHLEAGQAIRIPQVSVPADSPSASEAVNSAGKN